MNALSKISAPLRFVLLTWLLAVGSMPVQFVLILFLQGGARYAYVLPAIGNTAGYAFLLGLPTLVTSLLSIGPVLDLDCKPLLRYLAWYATILAGLVLTFTLFLADMLTWPGISFLLWPAASAAIALALRFPYFRKLIQ